METDMFSYLFPEEKIHTTKMQHLSSARQGTPCCIPLSKGCSLNWPSKISAQIIFTQVFTIAFFIVCLLQLIPYYLSRFASKNRALSLMFKYHQIGNKTFNVIPCSQEISMLHSQFGRCMLTFHWPGLACPYGFLPREDDINLKM